MQTLTNSPDVCALLNSFHDYTTDNQSDPFHPKILWTPPTDKEDALNAYLNAVNMTYSPLRTQTHPWQPTESSTPSFTSKTKTWHCYQVSRQRLGDSDNGQKMVLRRMLSPTQQSYFLRTTGYWSYWHYTETSYRIRQTNAQRWTYRQKKNNTYYIRILNPNASIFSLKSMKSIILSLFTDPLFSLQSCAVLGTCSASRDPCRVVSPNHALVNSLCSVRVFKLFSRSIHYIFGDEERVRTPTAR